MGPAPALTAVRRAVRDALSGVSGPVLVACSGGADSLALLAATIFEAGRDDEHHRHVIGVTVDHGLQEGSAAQAERVFAQMVALGAEEAMTARVDVHAHGQGLEAAAREARYAVLAEVAQQRAANAVLLGHTLDDQAETVLLGLTRGSGGRSIAGMRRAFPPFLRPLLDVTRTQTLAACEADGIQTWADPFNSDPRFTRSRVRQTVLPVMERELGPGVAVTLARTAELLREDMEALDALAEEALGRARVERGLDVTLLTGRPAAVVARVLRRAALEAGARPAELFKVHVDALRGLAQEPAGPERQVRLPGHVTAYRDGQHLRFRPTPVTG